MARRRTILLGMEWEPATPQRRTGRSVWAVVGIVAAVLLTIGGLAMVAVIVLVYVGLSQVGSNK